MSERLLVEHFVIVGYILGLLIISGAIARGTAVLVKDASEILASIREFRDAFAMTFLRGTVPVASVRNPWWTERH